MGMSIGRDLDDGFMMDDDGSLREPEKQIHLDFFNGADMKCLPPAPVLPCFPLALSTVHSNSRTCVPCGPLVPRIAGFRDDFDDTDMN